MIDDIFSPPEVAAMRREIEGGERVANDGLSAKVHGNVTTTTRADIAAARLPGDAWLEVAPNAALDLKKSFTLAAWIAKRLFSNQCCGFEFGLKKRAESIFETINLQIGV